MKVELDARPSNNNNAKPFFAIRLFPETNKEMADLEWGLSVTDGPDQVVRNCAGAFSIAIIFKDKENPWKVMP
jgi:hypothetical protein